MSAPNSARKRIGVSSFTKVMYAWVFMVLIVSRAIADPQVLLDENSPKADQTIDFAGRGRISIPVDTASAAPAFYRLTIASRDTTRTPVLVSIRTIGAPARALWSASLDPNETFTDREFVFQLDPHAERTALAMMTAQPHALEVGRIRLTRESRDDLIAQIKREHPDGDKRQNLCRISRFPLGIQSGWGLDREHSDEQMEVRTDESVIGPSGSPCVKLSVGGCRCARRSRHLTCPGRSSLTPRACTYAARVI